jgi:small nuclear ribonucleoprotein (snRNP)-like protein
VVVLEVKMNQLRWNSQVKGFLKSVDNNLNALGKISISDNGFLKRRGQSNFHYRRFRIRGEEDLKMQLRIN